MKIIGYTAASAESWDDLVARSHVATFLHTRRFLAYHEDRFVDKSVLILDEADRLLGVLPAAIHPMRLDEVVSHPGATFGGMVHAGRLRGEMMIEAMAGVIEYYRTRGFRILRYKAVPFIYHVAPAQDDLYALFRLGGRRYRCDISCTIDLARRLPKSERRKRALKRAEKNNIKIKEGVEHSKALWQVLSDNLHQRHMASPVHTLEEIEKLHALFPDAIRFVVAEQDNQVVAGVVLFASHNVVHAQYIASNEAGNAVNALDAVFEFCILDTSTNGCRYFDFGISNENEGWHLNAGLYQFKSEFGGGGVVHEFYELPLHGGSPE